MVFGILPLYLIDKKRKDDLLVYLKGLPIDSRDKKIILINWCKEVGAALTREMVEKAGAQ